VNKMSLYFKCLTLFCMFSHASFVMETDPELLLMEEVLKDLVEDEQSPKGPDLKKVSERLKKYDEKQQKIDKLEEEIVVLKRQISLLELNKEEWRPNKKRSSPHDDFEHTPPKGFQKKTCFNCSPSDVQNVIYMMYVAGEDNKSMISIPLRVDASKLDVGPITDANLFDALLETEVRLLQIILANSEVVNRTIYVGLTRGKLQARFKRHLLDTQDDIKKISSSKGIHIERALDALFNVKVSYLIDNIPEAYLKIFECLVSHLFLAQENGGSAVIATRVAWEKFAEYKTYAKRLYVLQKNRLADIVYLIALELFERKFDRRMMAVPINQAASPLKVY
jgi:hypothetical protein